MKRNASGFSIVETLLLLVVVSIIGFTGWFVWHSKQATDKTLKDASSAQIGTNAYDQCKESAVPGDLCRSLNDESTITTFAECKAAAGSVMQETYPETCVTKSGKSFTDTSQSGQGQSYLTIKEFGVKIPLNSAISDAYYTPGRTSDNFNLRVHSLDKLSDCKNSDGSVALIVRVTSSDYEQNKDVGEGMPSNGVTINGYYYYIGRAQYDCADASDGTAQDSALVSNIENAFVDASSGIKPE